MLYIQEKQNYSIEFVESYHPQEEIKIDKYHRSIVTSWLAKETFCTIDAGKWTSTGFTRRSYKDSDNSSYANAISLYRALIKAESNGSITKNDIYTWTVECPIFIPVNKKRSTWRKFMNDACPKSES